MTSDVSELNGFDEMASYVEQKIKFSAFKLKLACLFLSFAYHMDFSRIIIVIIIIILN